MRHKTPRRNQTLAVKSGHRSSNTTECTMRKWPVTGRNLARFREYKCEQDCFLKNEASVCVSNFFVIEDSKFKLCFFVVKDEQVTEEADMLIC